MLQIVARRPNHPGSSSRPPRTRRGPDQRRYLRPFKLGIEEGGHQVSWSPPSAEHRHFRRLASDTAPGVGSLWIIMSQYQASPQRDPEGNAYQSQAGQDVVV